jgi:hypothetical protein
LGERNLLEIISSSRLQYCCVNVLDYTTST